ncbi:MAG: twin-arginine translocase TatA/TatE family subunit [Proteobacteria bacterium]|nr:twin-arginine translocase TatA/TatE family subunit [Pseudomonadota bacterium]
MHATLAFGIGHTEIILIVLVVVILFGATKLPQLGSAIGQTVKNFKRGMREARTEEENLNAEDKKQLEDKSNDSDNKAA